MAHNLEFLDNDKGAHFQDTVRGLQLLHVHFLAEEAHIRATLVVRLCWMI